jgi:hypothetical protein
MFSLTGIDHQSLNTLGLVVTQSLVSLRAAQGELCTAKRTAMAGKVLGSIVLDGPKSQTQ